MSSNEERRDAARRKLEERLEQERMAARQRRITIISVASVAVLAAVAVGGYFYYRHWDNQRHTECTYTASPDSWNDTLKSIEEQVKAAPAEQKAKGEEYLKFMKEGSKDARTSPTPPSRTLNTGTVDWTLKTNMGNVPVTLERSSAPCNVNAVISLSNNKFYDGTSCHRLAQSENLHVLQCGDPTRTGAGSPGWSSPDENPTDLASGDVDPQMIQMGMTPPVIYPRGTVAIANRNNEQTQTFDTGSAQFFIVTKDSQLTPTLAVIGKVDEAGMKVIDKVVEGGIDPGPIGTAENGFPKTPLEIKSTSVTE
ncbi:MAG: peptidylprolyl isomerase [Gordonia sp. (in: high G+C Gram-positive bacteria)]|uniref:peptidylprolyl isomerase n=1 Tax=Gordonia sp. (in: high G+C Gram-positive bacteria) TaxID=84139 RepID=UPI003C759F6C